MPGFKGTMDEWKAGKLHSGSKHGPIVKDQKQALAIAFSEEDAPKKGPSVVHRIRRRRRAKHG